MWRRPTCDGRFSRPGSARARSPAAAPACPLPLPGDTVLGTKAPPLQLHRLSPKPKRRMLQLASLGVQRRMAHATSAAWQRANARQMWQLPVPIWAVSCRFGTCPSGGGGTLARRSSNSEPRTCGRGTTVEDALLAMDYEEPAQAHYEAGDAYPRTAEKRRSDDAGRCTAGVRMRRPRAQVVPGALHRAARDASPPEPHAPHLSSRPQTHHQTKSRPRRSRRRRLRTAWPERRIQIFTCELQGPVGASRGRAADAVARACARRSRRVRRGQGASIAHRSCPPAAKGVHSGTGSGPPPRGPNAPMRGGRGWAIWG